jgi:uncharacterized membrane protein YgdD (TMEM256/DUF423 family)
MKKITVIAAFLGFLGVALGAFGAHALRDQLAANGTRQTWQTAVWYQLLHASLAFLVTYRAAISDTRMQRAALAWLLGILLFSGSLYGLALTGPRWLGPITPLGGLCFLVGWALAGWAAWKSAPNTHTP